VRHFASEEREGAKMCCLSPRGISSGTTWLINAAAQSEVCEVKPPPNSPPMASVLGLHVEAATLGLCIETAAEELRAKLPTRSLKAAARPQGAAARTLVVAADYACQPVAVARPACARNQLLPFVNDIPCWRL
jgi:hypothetical protein